MRDLVYADLLPPVQTELAEDVLQMGFDGFVADVQRAGDFFVADAGTYQVEDFGFAIG